MANLMAYPSAAQGLSEGLQSGITLGIQMRKQREDEDNAVWQKQKFQEQQETQKTLTQIELNNKLLTTKGIANATKAKAWNDNNRLKMKLGGTDMGEITTWNPNTHDKLAGDLNSIYALTKDKAKPISLIEADNLMKERYMQALSDGELTKEEVDSIKEIAKTSQGMISKDAETAALSALSGSPEDIKQTLSSNLPLMEKGELKKQIFERTYPKEGVKEYTNIDYVSSDGRPLTLNKQDGKTYDADGNVYTGKVHKMYKPEDTNKENKKILENTTKEYNGEIKALQSWVSNALKSNLKQEVIDAEYTKRLKDITNRYKTPFRKIQKDWGAKILGDSSQIPNKGIPTFK